jgi:hypothetical protein
VTLATIAGTGANIALDATNMYWTEPGTLNSAGTAYIPNTGRVMSLALSGGNPTTIASAQNWPYGIAVDGTNVYWTNFALGAAGVGNVMKLPRDGSAVAIPLATGQTGPDAIAVDATNVYWTTMSGNIMSMPIAGGMAMTLDTGQSDPYNLVLNGSTLFWTNWTGSAGAVLSAPVTGGSVSPVASGLSQLFGLAVDATSVYWVQNSYNVPGVLQRIPRVGGSVTTLAPAVGPIAIDSANVYFVDNQDKVMRVPLTGGTAVTLVPYDPFVGLKTDSTFAFQVVGVGATSVYLAVGVCSSGSGSCGSEELVRFSPK